MTEWMDGAGSSLILTHGVFAYTIDTDAVGLILDGSGLEQDLPCELTCKGPVGYADKDVIRRIVAVTQPDRESKIIADDKHEAYSSPCDYRALVSWVVAMIFQSRGEEVMFVIVP